MRIRLVSIKYVNHSLKAIIKTVVLTTTVLSKLSNHA